MKLPSASVNEQHFTEAFTLKFEDFPSMTSLRLFTALDLLKFNNINLDPLTETYSISFYLTYLARWPDYFYLTLDHTGKQMGYVMGKAEGKDKNWHGHVTALTVAPEFRRMGLAAQLMNILEEVSDKM